MEELDAGVGVGRFGSFGGSTGRRTYSAQSFDTEERLGLTMDDEETFSKDSSKLALSGSRLASPSRPRSSRSSGDVATKFEAVLGVMRSVPPSEDRDTE